MKRIYLESNVFARAAEYGVTGEQLQTTLHKRGFKPVTGTMTVYEFTRGIENPQHEAAIRDQFSILWSLRPDYAEVSEQVSRDEIALASSDCAVQPFLGQEEAEQFHSLAHDYSRGKTDRGLQWIVEQRERHVDGPLRESFAEIVRRGKRLRDAEPSVARRGKDLRVAGDLLGYPVETIVSQILVPGLARDEYQNAIDHIDELPHLRSRVRMYQRLCQIMLLHGAIPKADKDRDPRHIADAAYCDAFVSADANLIRTQLPVINPDLAPVRWEELRFERSEDAGEEPSAQNPDGESKANEPDPS